MHDTFLEIAAYFIGMRIFHDFYSDEDIEKMDLPVPDYLTLAISVTKEITFYWEIVAAHSAEGLPILTPEEREAFEARVTHYFAFFRADTLSNYDGE